MAYKFVEQNLVAFQCKEKRVFYISYRTLEFPCNIPIVITRNLIPRGTRFGHLLDTWFEFETRHLYERAQAIVYPP